MNNYPNAKVRHRRKQAELRYAKQRQRNILAKPGAHEFILILDNLKAGFNVPKIFRSGQAFGAKEIHLVNIGVFDPAPAKGAFKYVPAKFHESFADCYATLKDSGYTFFILEPANSTALHEIELPKKSCFILGNEELGISFKPETYPDFKRLKIAQSGAVDSLNVSIAASIVMYQYNVNHPLASSLSKSE
ncbi:MAG: TrmH family RNA methyltransferase [Enterobacterales bacterium]|nr:TrmH family RNA methyltransferase [Enterobacterales bacterium]